jgi:L-ascorbate metabolism protein UlaG (beta-lactamase superfamily)
VHKIEPRVIIPMHYKIPGLTLPLETEKAFCSAMGNCPMQTLPKLNIKKKDLDGKLMEVILLERGV